MDTVLGSTKSIGIETRIKRIAVLLFLVAAGLVAGAISLSNRSLIEI